MKYAKTAMTFDQQADLLISRRMLGDRAKMIDRLSSVNYYRLSGYWYPFKLAGTNNFAPGTSFEMIWDRYVFDRQLRLLVMDAIERIEVYVRARLSNALALADSDPFAYINNPALFAGSARKVRSDHIAKLIRDYGSNRIEFVKHFCDKYGDSHPALPIWMAVETMTFGTMRELFGLSTPAVKKSVIAPFGVHETVMGSWLETLNIVRNMAAHHGRLWNRTMGLRPKIPAKDAQWHSPVEITNDRMFGVLSICRYCLRRIAPQSRWQQRLETLFAANPNIPIDRLGFPSNWKLSPIWN